MVILYEIDNFPSRVTLIAHCIREIQNRLPDEITGKESQRVQYVNLFDDVIDDFENQGISLEKLHTKLTNPQSQLSENNEASTLPKQLRKKLVSIAKEHDEKRETVEEKTRRLFEGLLSEAEIEGNLTPVVKHWKSIRDDGLLKLVHNHELDPSHKKDLLEELFSRFEKSLSSIVSPYHDIVEVLDEHLERANRRRST
jgi:hypothetical protein